MTEFAPDLIGLHPDDATGRCAQLGLTLQFDPLDDMWRGTYFGAGQPWHVSEQVPGPGEPLSSSAITVRVSVRRREGGAGVREPRRPLPPDRPLRSGDR